MEQHLTEYKERYNALQIYLHLNAEYAYLAASAIFPGAVMESKGVMFSHQVAV